MLDQQCRAVTKILGLVTLRLEIPFPSRTMRARYGEGSRNTTDVTISMTKHHLACRFARKGQRRPVCGQLNCVSLGKPSKQRLDESWLFAIVAQLMRWIRSAERNDVLRNPETQHVSQG